MRIDLKNVNSLHHLIFLVTYISKATVSTSDQPLCNRVRPEFITEAEDSQLGNISQIISGIFPNTFSSISFDMTVIWTENVALSSSMVRGLLVFTLLFKKLHKDR